VTFIANNSCISCKISFYKGAVWQGKLKQKNVDELLNSKAIGELMNGVLQEILQLFF
jgi:hypothetical protein